MFLFFFTLNNLHFERLKSNLKHSFVTVVIIMAFFGAIIFRLKRTQNQKLINDAKMQNKKMFHQLIDR